MVNDNFTKIPNAMLEKMCEMTPAELKIFLVVVRKTYGFQKQYDKISLSQFQEMSGLSRQGVINGIESGVNSGWLICEKEGHINNYWINANSDFFQTSQPSRPLDNETSQLNGLALVNEVDHLGTKLVNEVDTQKKSFKENIKEKDNLTAKQKYINEIITLFGISFRNNQQQDICLKWLKEYGHDRVMLVFEYYRLKGDSLGSAIAKMKTSLPKWKWNDIIVLPNSNTGGNENGYNV